MLRTHTCGELRKEHIGKEVVLAGWVHTVRDHGGVMFIDLRDRYGITQVVSNPQEFQEAHKVAETVKREYVIQVKGVVRARPEGTENKNLATGEIEVVAHEINILNKAKTPPFEIDPRVKVSENVRLKYRFLDLRREHMKNNLIFRHKFTKAVRDFFDKKGFLEIETPMLVKSTPEGARDFLVPSRLQKGKFFALPQSPQLYKQILMLAGFDKYFQIARCLRDEDLRADRQFEFTQIDLEMSFVEQEDVFRIIEEMFAYVFEVLFNKKLELPFPRISYEEAIEKYGLDKPDLRFDMPLINVTDIVKDSDFKVFSSAPLVKAIVAPKDFSRKEIEELTNFVGIYKAKGLAWMKYKEGKLESSITKFFSQEILEKLIERLKPKENSTIFFVADEPGIVNTALGHLRNKLGKDLKLYDPKEFKFVWVIDFPLFEWNEDLKKWDPAHHPFTMPKKEDIKYLEEDPGKVRAYSYDLVLNGWELGSGSIRITDPELQKKVFKVIGMSEEEAKLKFDFLLNAFQYGVPPHGGIALGLDRIVALLLGLDDIREVIAFPRNKAGENPMDGSPSYVDEEQLKELHIKVIEDEKEKHNKN